MTNGRLGSLCTRCIGRVSILAGPEPDATSPSPVLGCVGDFELIAEAGRGAMGVVYRARQLSLNRRVALKMVLNGQFAGDAERRRFEAEASVIATLDHPHIVPVLGFGEHEGRQYCAMRWLDGGPVSGPMPPREAVRLLACVARAVDHAHQRGVLHRDLKPGNILLDDRGEPFVTDFGLAKRLGTDATMTLPGSPVGTPAYMAPEQATGLSSPTIAADIWSLGAILHHWLTGRPPVEGSSHVDVLQKVREGRVTSPRQLNVAIDRDLDRICLQCLRLQPNDRDATAGALAEDLERWQRHEPVRARAASLADRIHLLFRRRPAVMVLGLVLLLSLAAGTTGVLLQWRRAEREREDARIHLLRLYTEKAQQAVEAGDPLGTLPWMVSALASEPPGSTRARVYRDFLSDTLRRSPVPERMWFLGGPVAECLFAHDGRTLLATVSRGPTHLLPFHDPDPATPASAPAPFIGGNWKQFLNPDGTELVSVDRSGLVQVHALPDGRVLRSFETRPEIGHVIASADGRYLALAGMDQFVEVRRVADGSLVCPPMKHAAEIVWLQFSPDASRLVTVPNNRSLFLHELPSGRELAALRRDSFFPVRFDEFGNRLLVVARPEFKVLRLDAATLQPIGEPIRLSSPGLDAWFSPDGSRIATAERDGTARVWDAATGQAVTPPLRHDSEVHEILFNAEGDRIATRRLDPMARVWNARTGEPLTPWLRHAGTIHSMVFSPEGSRIATASRDGSVRLWNIPAPLKPDQRLPQQPRPVWNVTFSADFRHAFVHSRNRGRVWALPDWEPLSAEIQQKDVIDEVRFSPDRQLLLTGSRDGTVAIRKLGSDEPLRTFDHSSKVTVLEWLPDSRRVFSAGGDGDYRLWDSTDGRVIHSFTNRPFETTWAGAVSPDGRTLAGAAGGWVIAWDTTSGAKLWNHTHTNGAVHFLRFSPDGSALFSGDDSGRARLQETRTGQRIVGEWNLEVPLTDMAFSPDGTLLAVAARDGVVRLWNTRSGLPTCPPLRPAFGLERLRFSPDGRILATRALQSLQLWDVATGTPITSPFHVREEIGGIGFVGPRRVVAVTESAGIHVFEPSTLAWSTERFTRAARLLSGLELDPAGGLRPSTMDATEAKSAWEEIRESLIPQTPSR